MGLFDKKEETDPAKIRDKAVKDLVGGSFSSTELDNRLNRYKLFPISHYSGEIRKTFKKAVKEEDVPIDKLEDRLNQLIEQRLNNLNPTEIEIRKLEIEIREKENQLETIEDSSEKRKLKKEIDYLKKMIKASEKRERIRNGVKCKVPKYVQGQKGHSGLTKAVAAYELGMVGWAATSGSKSELQEMLIPSIIKVLPKGVVIEIEHEQNIRIPFEDIIKADNSVSTIHIHIVGNQEFTVKDCKDYNEVTLLINESACGREDEGWTSESEETPIAEKTSKISSDLNELERLANLYEKGLLNDEDFEIMKRKIIDR